MALRPSAPFFDNSMGIGSVEASDDSMAVEVSVGKFVVTSASESIENVTVYSFSGSMPLSRAAGSARFACGTEGFAPGVYVVKVAVAGDTVARKFVVKRFMSACFRGQSMDRKTARQPFRMVCRAAFPFFSDTCLWHSFFHPKSVIRGQCDFVLSVCRLAVAFVEGVAGYVETKAAGKMPPTGRKHMESREKKRNISPAV